MAASPNALARASIMAKFYLLFTPLPPETTILADVKSGFPESELSSFTNSVLEPEGSGTSVI
jgi:hypothetical protein